MDKEKQHWLHHCPQRIVIVPDDYHVIHAGKTMTGKQFLVTTPFDFLEKSRDFLAIFFWDKQGDFLEADIEYLGTREEVTADFSIYEKLLEKKLAALIPYRIMSINVAPFEVEQFDTKFGLIYKKSLLETGFYEAVELHPGNSIAFTPPWDGNYYT